MRESTRKLNKILLDSLQNVGRKKHAFTRLYSLTYESKLKNNISRFMALSLALLLLFNTVTVLIASSAGYREAGAAMILIAIPYALAEVPSFSDAKEQPSKTAGQNGWSNSAAGADLQRLY